MRYERLSQPTTEPLPVAEVQVWIPGADAAWVTAALPLVRDYMEQELQRVLAPCNWRVWYNRGEIIDCVLHLPLMPAASLTAITAYLDDGSTANIPTTGCQVMGYTLFLSDATLSTITSLSLRARDALAVEAVIGHGHTLTTPAPPAVLLGLRELLAYWHQHRGEGFSLLRTVPQDTGAGGGYTTSPPVPQWVLRRLAGYYHR